MSATAAALEAEVDAAIAACGGDARAALRATLIANAYLEGEVERLAGTSSRTVAHDHARRRATRAPRPRKAA